MSKYEVDKETELKLKAEADEYSKSYAFGFDKQDMLYKFKIEGMEIPDDEKLNEMVKEEYIEIRKREIFCEKNGHDWKETNADLENGTSDLDCECCGEHNTLHWM